MPFMRADSALKAEDTVTEIETIDGRRVPLTLAVNPRARRISIRIDPMRGIAIATAPSKRQLKRAAQFAAERVGWIAKELAALPQRAVLLPHTLTPLRGVMHELIYEQGRGHGRIEPPDALGAPPRLVAPAPDLDLFEARVKRFFKAEALKDLTARVAVHCAMLGVRAQKIQVKETRSRWGSCSTDGALSFSWRVILAPPFVLDYLAAHEVAHLKEMNHSPRFWAHVARLCPEHEAGRAWLHTHGAVLHAIGEA